MKVAIVCGTVYGSAEEVARHAAALLRAAGHETLVNPRLMLPELLAFEPQALLAVTSTTGMGELPDNLMPLYAALRDGLPGELRGLPGGVIALGDASYGDTFAPAVSRCVNCSLSWALAKYRTCCVWTEVKASPRKPTPSRGWKRSSSTWAENIALLYGE